MMEAHVNPYELRPVDTLDFFGGRFEEIETLEDMLKNCSHRNQQFNLIVLGPKDYGKTSLLNVIKSKAKDLNLFVVDIGYLFASKRTMDEIYFFEMLINELSDEIQSVTEPDIITKKFYNIRKIILYSINNIKWEISIKIAPITLHLKRDEDGGQHVNTKILINKFKKISNNAQKKDVHSIILLHDDFDRFFTYNLKESDSVLTLMGKILSNTGGYNLAFSMADDDLAKRIGNHIPLIKSIELKEFCTDDTKDCILKPLCEEDKCLVDPSIYNQICELTFGCPRLVKLFAHYMYDEHEKSKSGKMRITIDVLQDVNDALKVQCADPKMQIDVENLIGCCLSIHSMFESAMPEIIPHAIMNEKYIIRKIGKPEEDTISTILCMSTDDIVYNIESRTNFTLDEKRAIKQKMFVLQSEILKRSRKNTQVQCTEEIKECIEENVKSVLKDYFPAPINLEEIMTTINEGADFLREKNPDSAWYVSMIILSLLEIGDSKESQTIKECTGWLEHNQRDDGGWESPLKKNAANIFDTSFAVVALTEAGIDIKSDNITKAVDFIKKSVDVSCGGWPANPWDGKGVDVGATSWAVIALLNAGIHPSSDIIRNAIEWLRNNQLENGGWGAWSKEKSKNSIITRTFDSVTALLTAGVQPQDEIIQNAVKWTINLQNLKSEGKKRQKWFWEWETDEIHASNIENTAVAIITLLNCGESANHRAVKAGINWLMDRKPDDGQWSEGGINSPRVIMCLNKYTALKEYEE